jgi:hypothetical protein
MVGAPRAPARYGPLPRSIMHSVLWLRKAGGTRWTILVRDRVGSTHINQGAGYSEEKVACRNKSWGQVSMRPATHMS